MDNRPVLNIRSLTLCRRLASSTFFLLSLFLTVNETAASVGFACPCSFEQGSGLEGNAEFSLVFHEDTNESGSLKLQLVLSNQLSIYSDGFYTISETTIIPSLPFSDSTHSLEVPLTLSEFSNMQTGYPFLFIRSNNGTLLDTVLLGTEKKSWGGSSDELSTTRISNVDTLLDTDGDGITDYVETLKGTSPNEFDMVGPAIIEVAFTYGGTVEDIYGDDLAARIAHIIAVTNQSFLDSGVDTTLEFIGIYNLGNDAALSASEVLDDLEERSGLFSNLDDRFTRKPDLIIHLSSTNALNTGGLAHLIDSYADGVVDAGYLYESGRNAAAIGLNNFDVTLAHEVGHLLGLDHSVLNDGDDGTFAWSRGYGKRNKFVTIMGYPSKYGSANYSNIFSSPALVCGEDGDACGVEKSDHLYGADSVAALQVTSHQIAAVSNGFSPTFTNIDPGIMEVLSESEINIDEIVAGDTEDGDVTDFIEVELVSTGDQSADYNFIQTLSVTDSDGNTTTITRFILLQLDTDEDGIFDSVDDDDDNDGVLDDDDLFPLNFLEWTDFDGDGIGDNGDADDDNDGISDSLDAFPLDPEFSMDTDSDGLADSYEARFGLDPDLADDSSQDLDGDGLTLIEEFGHRTSPLTSDTDKDTLPDEWELENNHDPLVPYIQIDGMHGSYTMCSRIDRKGKCWGIYAPFTRTFNNDIKDFSVSEDGTLCVVDSSGIMFCWGSGNSELLPYTPSLQEVTAIGIGNGFGCASLSDGTLKCWGLALSGLYENPDEAGIQIDASAGLVAGATGICAVGAKSLVCWHSSGRIKFESESPLAAAEVYQSTVCASYHGLEPEVFVAQEGTERSVHQLGNNICTNREPPSAGPSISFGLGYRSTCSSSEAGISCDEDSTYQQENLTGDIITAADQMLCSIDLLNGIQCSGRPDLDSLFPPLLVIDPDGDGVTSQNGEDLFPLDGTEAFDNDLDGIGDNADPDDDNDGTLDDLDAFPFDPAESLDTDADSLGNNVDPDDDGDGISDELETSQGTDPLDFTSCYQCQIQLSSGGLLVRGSTEGNSLSGSDFDDEIYGLEGDDSIAGLGGNDYLVGDAGDDLIVGGSGADQLFGGPGDDDLKGGSGNDIIRAGEGADKVSGGSDHDELYGEAGNDEMSGGSGDDLISGEAGNDQISGGSGDDLISGGDGSDVIDGGSGFNEITGGTGTDIFVIANAVTFSAQESLVKDFEDGIDYIATQKIILNTQDYIALAGVESTGTEILFEDGEKIFLEGISSEVISLDDFLCLDQEQDPLSTNYESVSDLVCNGYVDSDGDGVNDVSDSDDDNDGVLDQLDAFPLDSTESLDTDADGIGNNQDSDDDGDGVADQDDGLSLISLDGRLDSDGDGFPDDCDQICIDAGLLVDDDDDNDGVSDVDDAFPLDESESVDTDADGIGDNADNDDDDDGVADDEDQFPLDPDETIDSDHDGIGDNADWDDDNDGVADGADLFPLDSSESGDADSDGIGNNADEDDDNDLVLDSDDAFPEDERYAADLDGDGLPDEWEEQYGLDSDDPKNAYFDLDQDGYLNWEEFLSGSDPAVAERKAQVIYTDRAAILTPARTSRFTVSYTTTDLNPNLTGVGIRIHYNSAYVTEVVLDNIFDTGLLGVDLAHNDEFDLDGDADTDRYFIIAWADTNDPTWPGQLPTDLFDIVITTTETIVDLDYYPIRFSVAGAAVGYNLSVPSVYNPVVLASLDIDGDGEATALSDGLMVIRRFFGFTGDSLISGAVSDGATYKTAETIAERIDAFSDGFDVDADGQVEALTDGLMIIRRLFGFSGESLVAGALSASAERTDPDEIAAYIDSLAIIND